MDNNEMKFCQSCGMPLTDDLRGTNADGSKSDDYCVYCYKDGAFTGNFTMEEMVENCIPHMSLAAQDPEGCRAYMRALLPTLERWK